MDDSLEDVGDLLGRLPHDPSVADLLIGPVFRKNLYKEGCGPPSVVREVSRRPMMPLI